MKKVSIVFMILVALLTLGVSCNKKAETTTATAPASTSTSTTASAPAPAVTQPKVEYKDTAIIGFQTKTSTTNPTANTSVMHRLFFNLTHDTLIDYDEATSSLKPGLATEWKASDDFKVWTFTLRDNVYFHNGVPIQVGQVSITSISTAGRTR